MDEANEEKRPIFEYYSEVKDKEIKWLWYPFIPYGKITLVQGDPGEGKSTFMLNLVALLTRGQNLPDGTKIPHPMNVIYQCMEDDAADTIKPRLVKAGADCSKVAYIIDDTGELNLEDSRIKETIRETGAGMLILDPLQSFLVQDTDMHFAGRMRAVLGKLGSIDIAAIARKSLWLQEILKYPASDMLLQLNLIWHQKELQLDIYSFKDEGKWFWALPSRQEERTFDGEGL